MSGILTHAARAGALGAIVALAACGSSGSANLTEEERVAEFEDISIALEKRFNTAYLEEGAIPDAGEGQFKGYAGLVFGDEEPDLALLGEAEITVNWATEDIDGTISNFFGDDGSTVEDYTGDVTINNGDFLGNQPNAFTFDYAGNLEGQGNTIALDGSGDGILKGTPIRGLLASSDLDDTAMINGEETNFLMGIAAEYLD